MSKTLLVISSFAIAIIAFFLFKDLNEQASFGTEYSRVKAKVIAVLNRKNCNSQEIVLKYPANGQSFETKYERTILRRNQYRMGEEVLIYYHDYNPKTIIIDGALKPDIKIEKFALVLSIAIFLINLFWVRLKRFLI